MLGWLKKKKNKEDEQFEFQPFQVGHLRIVFDTLSANVDWGSMYVYKLLQVLLVATRSFSAIKLPCKC